MKSGVDEKTRNKIVALISALLPEAKIYLFGSRARETHSQWSDIDLALDMGKKMEWGVVGEIKSVLENTNIPHKIEVVDFHSVSSEMKQAIRQEAIEWK